jgi:protein-tyrosine phosphatase
MNRFTRSLHLQGASNFRDLGGYYGQDGRQVRWRRLFRSDHLAGLTAQDKALLSQLGVHRVFDFRGVTERTTAECALDHAKVFSLPIEPTVVGWLSANVDAGRRPTAADTVQLMHETYRAFASDNSHRYRELFRHLLESDEPLVFHCTAGKDRTGFAAALILLALGVPRDVVLEDYLLTNSHYKFQPNPDSPLPADVQAVLHRVQEDFLEAALQVVDRDFGGPAQYLSKGLGVTDVERGRLAALYLEQAS